MTEGNDTEGDHAHFTRMLDFVPTNFYFDEESKKLLRDGEEETDEDSEEEIVENKTQKQNEATKSNKRAGEELSLKAKWKRAKFDPAQIMTVSQMTEEIANKEAASQQKPKDLKKTMQKPPSVPNPAEDLHQRLKAKIELMQAKRHALDRKDEFQKRRLKRKEKKAKQKLRQNHEKQERATNGTVSTKAKPLPVTKPVYNKEGKMVFSKFDFQEKRESRPDKKNFKALLEKVQKEKEKVENLKKTDEAAATSLKQKQQWQNVIKKAEGVKVRDDPDLLKKAMKRKEKRKEKSKKNWKEREEKVEAKIKQRQDKRASNIKKKKEGRINKKITKAKKKGRVIPGF